MVHLILVVFVKILFAMVLITIVLTPLTMGIVAAIGCLEMVCFFKQYALAYLINVKNVC